MSNHDWDWLEVLCQDFDRARSLTVLLLVRYNEWDQLIQLRCRPSDYCTVFIKERGVYSTTHFPFHTNDDFRYDYQISELLRKNADLPLTNVDPEAKCKESFWNSEYQCANTNIRLRQLVRQHKGDWFHPGPRIDRRWQEVVKLWRKKVRDILGPIPNDLIPKFSSGATFDDRRYLLPQDKMSSRPTSTLSAYQVLEPFWSKTLWCRGLTTTYPDRSSPRFVRGDRFTMVPKSAETHRGICVSPSINVTYQLSVGKIIRKRLSMQGIDLKYGQSVHQRLAEQASLTLDLATIDLSSASDTVASELVKLVLPNEWFELLNALRCEETRIDGKWRKLEKFSAMGNGYTFELETLLFYTLGLTVAELLGHYDPILTVYGDDIICESVIAKQLVTALRFFGFIPNERKTFLDGTPFRESCGGDYYRGLNVRGYYLESLPTEPIDYVKLANGIRRMAKPDLDAFCDLHRYKRSWLRVISHLPTNVSRCRGPEIFGDLCLHDHETCWAIKYKRGEKYIRTLQPTFDDSATTSYDRKFWTRDSIVAAATLGLLHGQGDTFILTKNGRWKCLRGVQRISRVEPVGYEIKDIPFSFAYKPDQLKEPERLLKSIRQNSFYNRSRSVHSLTNYWVNWLLTSI